MECCQGLVTDIDKIKKYVGVNKTGYVDYGDEKEKVFKDNFKEWRCNLRLGKEVYISSEDAPKKLKKGEFVVIKPGDFVLLLTREHLQLEDDVMGFISMRFDYKQKGLINVSGFHVDPNYDGKLIFSAFNAGPKDIVLRESDPVFMIFFERMNFHCTVQKEKKGFTYIPADIVEQIRGKSVTLSSNANRLDRMEFYLKIVSGMVIAISMSLIGMIIRELIHKQ